MKIKNILFKILPIVSIVVLFFSYGLLYIPFSGVAFWGGNHPTFDTWVSAFVAFFPHVQQYFSDNIAKSVNVAPAGIVLLSFMLVALLATVANLVISLVAIKDKKVAPLESFFKLVSGIFLALSAFMLLSLQLWMVITYPTESPVVLWCPYIGGTLLAVVAGLTIWAAIDALIKEKNAPLESKGFSYLKK